MYSVNVPDKRFLKNRLSLRSSYKPKLSESAMQSREQIISNLRADTYTLRNNPCPTCNSSCGEVLVGEIDRYGIPVTTVLCRECGLLRTDPIMNSNAYEDFYKNYYRSLYNGSELATEDFFNDQVLRGNRLHAFLSSRIQLRDKIILEVGVGAGGILSALCQSGATGIGCDFGESYLDYAKTKGLEVRIGDLTTFSDKSADIIVYSHVLEHVSDLKHEFVEIRRVLKSGGYLLVNVPGVYSIHRDYAGDFLQYLQNAHLFHFTKRSLRRLMNQNGFKELYANEKVVGLYVSEKMHLLGPSIPSSSFRMVLTYLSICNAMRPLLMIPHVAYRGLITIRRNNHAES